MSTNRYKLEKMSVQIKSRRKPANSINLGHIQQTYAYINRPCHRCTQNNGEKNSHGITLTNIIIFTVDPQNILAQGMNPRRRRNGPNKYYITRKPINMEHKL